MCTYQRRWLIFPVAFRVCISGITLMHLFSISIALSVTLAWIMHRKVSRNNLNLTLRSIMQVSKKPIPCAAIMTLIFIMDQFMIRKHFRHNIFMGSSFRNYRRKQQGFLRIKLVRKVENGSCADANVFVDVVDVECSSLNLFNRHQKKQKEAPKWIIAFPPSIIWRGRSSC